MSDKLYWMLPCLISCALFLPALRFGFIFDDHRLIISNPWVHSWTYLPKLLTSHLWAFLSKTAPDPQYRPMFSVWLLTLYTFGQRSTVFWHLSSIALDVTATYFVFRLSRELLGSDPAASWAALLFAIHPIHDEPVCWIASCNELLYTTAVLCSLFLFLRARRNQADSQFWIWVSVGLWGAAIFTKESALPVLAVFFYLAYRTTEETLSLRQRLYQATRQAMPYLAAVVLYFIARFAFVYGIGFAIGRHTWKQVIYSAPLVTAFYLKKLLLPIELSSFYAVPLISSPTTQMWIVTALLVISIAVLAWVSVKRSPAWGTALMLLFLPMLPVLAGIRVFVDGDLAHDRYMYLPSVGLCIFGALAAKYFLGSSPKKKTAAKAVGYSFAIALALFTVAHEGTYASDETYFARGVQTDPNNYLARDYLGDVYLQQREMALALPQFERAHELVPRDTFTTFRLARGLFEDKQYSKAEPYLQELADASYLDRVSRPTVLLAFGETEIRLKHLSYAEKILERLESEDETYPALHRTLGTLYLMEGRIPKAQAEFSREFEVSGDPASEHEAVELGNLMRDSAGDATSSRTGISQ